MKTNLVLISTLILLLLPCAITTATALEIMGGVFPTPISDGFPALALLLACGAFGASLVPRFGVWRAASVSLACHLLLFLAYAIWDLPAVDRLHHFVALCLPVLILDSCMLALVSVGKQSEASVRAATPKDGVD